MVPEHNDPVETVEITVNPRDIGHNIDHQSATSHAQTSDIAFQSSYYVPSVTTVNPSIFESSWETSGGLNLDSSNTLADNPLVSSSSDFHDQTWDNLIKSLTGHNEDSEWWSSTLFSPNAHQLTAPFVAFPAEGLDAASSQESSDRLRTQTTTANETTDFFRPVSENWFSVEAACWHKVVTWFPVSAILHLAGLARMLSNPWLCLGLTCFNGFVQIWTAATRKSRDSLLGLLSTAVPHPA